MVLIDEMVQGEARQCEIVQVKEAISSKNSWKSEEKAKIYIKH